jgi:flagellar biosynthesis component FlhA
VQVVATPEVIVFLAGLKFALGLITGLAAVFGIVVGIIVVAEWACARSEKLRHNRYGMNDPAKIALGRRNPVFLRIRYPAWVDEPTESERRKSEFMQ